MSDYYDHAAPDNTYHAVRQELIRLLQTNGDSFIHTDKYGTARINVDIAANIAAKYITGPSQK